MDALVDQFDASSRDDEDADPATLDIPIDVNFQKKQFDTLRLREPKAKEIAKAELELNVPQPTAYHFRRYQMALIAAVAKVPPEVVGELTNTQLVRAWRFLQERLDVVSPPTGEA